MAKQFDKIVIPVELQVKDDGTAKELESKVKGLEKVAAKGLVYQINLDEKNYAKIIKQVSEISAIGGKVVFNFQENGLEKMGKDAKAFVETIKQAYNDALNPKNIQSGSSNNIASGQLKSLEQVNVQIEQQKKRYNELQAEIKKYNDAQSKAAQKSAQAVKDSWNNYIMGDEKKASANRKEFAKQFKAFSDSGFDKSLLNWEDSYGEVFNFEKYQKKYEKALKSIKNFNLDKEVKSVTDQFNLPFDSSQLQKYIEENNKLVASIKELQKVKQELESAKKETTDGKTSANDSTKTQENNSGNAQTDGYHQVKIEPANLEEFYGKIENHKTAKINVEVGNKDNVFNDLENDPIKVNIGKDNTNSKNESLKYVKSLTNEELEQIFKDSKTENLTTNARDFQSKANEIYSNILKTGEITETQIAKILSYGSIKKESGDAYAKKTNEARQKQYNESKRENLSTPRPDLMSENNSISVFDGVAKQLEIDAEQLSTAFKDVAARLNLELNNEFVSKNAKALSESSLDVVDSTKNNTEPKTVNGVEVELIPSTESIANLKSSIETNLNPIKVTLEATNIGELQSLIAEEKNLLQSPTSPANNAAYTVQEDSLQRIIELQKQVNEGDRTIAKTVDSVGKLNNPNIKEEALAKGSKTTTKKSINDLLKQYDKETSGKDYKNQLASYVASYKDVGSLENTSFKKYPELWKEITVEVEKATASQKAYNEILQEAAKIKGSDLTAEETKTITDSLNSESLGKVIQDTVGVADVQTSDSFDGLKTSINSVIETIGTIGTAYQTATADVEAGADAQIQSINTVKEAITSLSGSLELVGVKTLEELPQYTQQMEALRAEEEKLNKQKEAFEKLKAKKNGSKPNGSKEKEQLSNVDKLKTALGKTKGVTLDEDSIQQSSNGIITFTAEIQKANEEAQKLVYTVGSVDEILNKNGTVKQKYLKEGQSLSPTTVEADADTSPIVEKTVDDITRLKEMASNTIGFNIDKSSITKADDGIITFTANVANAKGELEKLSYTIQDMSLIGDKNGGFNATFKGAGKSDDDLDKEAEKESKKLEKQKIAKAKAKSQETLNKLNSAAENTSGLYMASSSIEDDGFIRFTAHVEDADGKVKTLTYSVKELKSILNDDGTISKDFLNTDNLSKIEEVKNKLVEQIATNKSYEAAGQNDLNVGGMEKQIEYQTQINALLENANISDQQRAVIEEQIVAALGKQAEFFDVNDKKNASAQKDVRNLTERYSNTLDKVGYTSDENSFSNLNERITIFDQLSEKVMNVKEKMVQLKTAAAELNDKLSNGQFTDKGMFERTKEDLQKTLSEMEQLADNPAYQQMNKSGQSYWRDLFEGKNLNLIPKSEVENELTKQLQGMYDRVLKNVEFNPKNGTAVGTVLNNGQIEKVTMSLDGYTNALGKAQVAVHSLNQSQGEYVTTGQKWINGFKGKIASLSQYVTGLSAVMKAVSELKEGFNFVKELDSSLTTINQTMSATSEQLSALGQGSIDAGKKLGASATSVLDAAAIYANANETTESVLEKAKPTVMLANASGGDISTASDQIQSVTQQFSELEGQERRIVNSYEKISAGISVDFQKGIGIIAEGTKNAGTVAKESGMQFEDFAASVAKVSERTRQDGSSIGNAYKQILARTSRSQSADLDVSDEDRSKASAALKSVAGISVYDENGEYQDFSKTLDQLSAKWDKLSKSQQSYVNLYNLSL